MKTAYFAILSARFRVLLQYRSAALQVACQELLLNRVGRLLQGAAALSWSLHALPIHWTTGKMMMIIISILSGASLFYGLFVPQATLSFWAIETLELMNILTYGGTETGQYPLSIFRTGFRTFFTFVVPLACMNIIPFRMLIGSGNVIGWLNLFAGFIFLIAALQIWRIGVRHYTSTGS